MTSSPAPARRPDPLLAERHRLGVVQLHTLRAPSLVDAHGALGARLREPARTSILARLATTQPGDLESRLRAARESRAFMEARAADAHVAAEVRGAIGEYLACLDAWSHAAGAGEWLPEPLTLDGRRVTTEELGLWAQDDNTGCQTGTLRQADGSVLLDNPRLATFEIPGETLSAFVYPYLLPGPAFGFRADQIHAVDSLVLKRGLAPRGGFTSVASWLVWRLGSAAPASEILRALSPYLDGCAINLVRRTRRGVQMETHEIGGRHVQSRRLRPDAGAFCVQANAVLRAESPLTRHEHLSPRARAPYERRVARARAALGRRLATAGEPAPDDIVQLLASRRGGRYAFANLTVKAHCVARVSAEGFEIYVRSGAAHPADVYRPQWRSP